MEPEQYASERLIFIDERQKLLMEAVVKKQNNLYISILNEAEKIVNSPSHLVRIFNAFNRKDLLELVDRFIVDLFSILKRNNEYFQFISNDSARYKKTKLLADEYLKNRLGINPMRESTSKGYIDLFIKDTSIQQRVRLFAYKAQTSGSGLQEFKRGIKEIITGGESGTGLVEKHFNTYALDTYQQVDATIQETYAVELDLQAALYAGVAVAGSRQFCRDRKGKVFTREEIAEWADLKPWNGRTEPYNPFIDRGGYGCLDGFNYITNEMALRRRKDLALINGKLEIVN